MKHLLVPMLGNKRDDLALDAAVKLAGSDGAHIDARLFLRDPIDVVPYIGEGVSSATAVTRLVEEASKNAEKLRHDSEANFKTWCERNKIDTKQPFEKGRLSARFAAIKGALPSAIVPVARLADVSIFVGHEDTDSPDRRDLLSSALFESGRPTLLVPSIVPAKIGTRIMIAWNGSAEAARAVTAAMPLMPAAEAVYVVTVDDREDNYHGPALAETLQMNGIAATAVAADAGKEDIGACLNAEAAKVSADLIVIGAYSHNRLREMVLGGVTRDLQEHLRLPTLMVH